MGARDGDGSEDARADDEHSRGDRPERAPSQEERAAGEAGEPRPMFDSVSEVNGTVARFEMAYSPPSGGERVVFGPPMAQRLPSLVFLVFGLTLCAVVAMAYTGSSNSVLYVWILEGDRSRPIGAAPLAGFVLLSAIGTVLRAQMRGVIVHADRLEARYLLALGMPRVRRWTWAQIERLVIDEDQIMLEMWDSTYEILPPVADTRRLAATLEGIAMARKLRVTRMPKIAARGA